MTDSARALSDSIEDDDHAISQLRSELKQQLDELLLAKVQEFNARDAAMQDSNWLLVHTGAALKGAWDSAVGTVEAVLGAVDAVNSYLGPWTPVGAAQDLLAGKMPYETAVGQTVNMGVGIAKGSAEVAEATQTVMTLLSDGQTRRMLQEFVDSYCHSTHSTIVTEFGGSVAFDLLVGLATAGAGSVATAGKGARVLDRISKSMRELGILLSRRKRLQLARLGFVRPRITREARRAYDNAKEGQSFYALFDGDTGNVHLVASDIAKAQRAFLEPGASGHMAAGHIHGLPRGTNTFGFSVAKTAAGPRVTYRSAYNMTARSRHQSSDPTMAADVARHIERELRSLRPNGSTQPVGGPSNGTLHRGFAGSANGPDPKDMLPVPREASLGIDPDAILTPEQVKSLVQPGRSLSPFEMKKLMEAQAAGVQPAP